MQSGSRSRFMHSMWVSWNWDLSDVLRLHAFVRLFVFQRKELWQMSAEAACHLAFRQNQAFFFFFFSKGVLLHICLCTSTKMFMYFYKYMLTTQRQISFETNIWLRLFPLLWGNFHMAILSLASCQSLSLRSKTAQHCFPWDLWPLSFLLSSRIEQLFLALLERRASCTKERDSFNFIIVSNPHQS